MLPQPESLSFDKTHKKKLLSGSFFVFSLSFQSQFTLQLKTETETKNYLQLYLPLHKKSFDHSQRYIYHSESETI